VRGWRRRAEVEPLPDPAEVCPVVARAG
jgi:hypothetical protein